MKSAAPSVIFRKPVSDVSLQILLDRLAQVLGASITVHSGDRDHRPKGSPSRSLHLMHRAADFHVSGMSDRHAFDVLKTKRGQFTDLAINRFQVIHHGPYTETEGEHLHVGDYSLIKAAVIGPGVMFLTEGTSPGSKGKYTAAV